MQNTLRKMECFTTSFLSKFKIPRYKINHHQLKVTTQDFEFLLVYKYNKVMHDHYDSLHLYSTVLKGLHKVEESP